jgi:transposase
LIDLFYGDESQVSSEGYCPYGWQFPGEEVCVYVEKGYKTNIFGLISRDNQCHWAMTSENIDSQFVVEQLDDLSFKINKKTFVVLDNASIHSSKLFQNNRDNWENRGLYIFHLPTYSPQLNIAETMWRIMKTKWLKPEDYLEKDTLFYAVNRCMANIGVYLNIKFSPFNAN